ncbi:hypothetical protein NKH85_19685 [Mesorhizobium sp. M0924]|uniref:hypothetical protein n=1 Tax=unclassified Mesorhizobium TaxID=325217 RepID=UPI00333C2482
MSNAITGPHVSATISEQELFAEFLKNGIVLFNRAGKVKSTISADEMFTAFPEVLEFLPDCLDHLRDYVEGDESPSISLELAESDLLGAAKQLALVRKHFNELMYEREADDQEANEPRYSVSVSGAGDTDHAGEGA